ncbi:MAG: ABC-F family ATP-binding cassette domain-containing protein [Catonella sp.]|uniref:ABC-F family ATP-binding cassette domain-containing protein n=1 Tax=Catonella sp. TaxID=2382125 RepID=UPI003F9F664E
MVLSCNNISKEFVTGPVLKEVSFHINEREKVAVVGINGAGKSTLLKIIMNEMSADSGDVFLAKGATIGYLAQHQNIDTELTIFDVMLEVKKDILELADKMRILETKMKQADGTALDAVYEEYSKVTHEFELKNGYAYKSEITGILKGLGFDEEEFSRKVNTLSGGQKTRAYLARLLLSKPDIILLDEPTNHLDMKAIGWLETYLKNFNGAVLIVAHDRYFLDNVAEKVVEINNCKATTFLGNYTDYANKKKALREAKLKAYLNQQKEIAHQETVIDKLRSFNSEKSIKRAESREKMLGKIEKIDKPTEIDSSMKISLKPHKESGKDVLNVENLTKSFDDTLFENISFEIKRGERVAIIGGNGTGKTTLLKIINALLPSDSGKVTLGTNVEIGYYDQEHQVLSPDKTLFNEISDEYPYLTNTEIRNVLASFLFTKDDVFKLIGTLSGGEKGRVSLAKLMLSEANFLLLDEPTNHLDITSKEILEDALNSYEGTVLYVSHDRYFINKTATRILDLTGKQLINYIGNYDYYLEKKETLESAFLNNNTSDNVIQSETSANRQNWQLQKEEQKELRKIQNELKRIEDEVAKLEEENTEFEKQLLNPAISSDVGKLMEIHKQKTANDERIESLLERWEELSVNV